MASKRTWLTGCGIGCLVIVAAAVIGGSLLWRAGRTVIAAFDEVGESQAVLTQQYGGLRDYAPSADGRIAPGRVEAFLAVLADTREPAVELSGHGERLRRLEGDGGAPSPGDVISGLKSIPALGRSVAAYLGARNEALITHGMGFGEYSYLWTIVYLSGGDREFTPTFSVYEDEDVEQRPIRLRGHFEAWLENQIEAAEAEGLDRDRIRDLEYELSRIRRSELTVPWLDGLPDSTAESLAPYRDRLDAAYVDLGAMLCIGADKSGREGYDFEIQ